MIGSGRKRLGEIAWFRRMPCFFFHKPSTKDLIILLTPFSMESKITFSCAELMDLVFYVSRTKFGIFNWLFQSTFIIDFRFHYRGGVRDKGYGVDLCWSQGRSTDSPAPHFELKPLYMKDTRLYTPYYLVLCKQNVLVM